MKFKSVPSVMDMPEVKGRYVLVRAELDTPTVDGVLKSHFRIQRAIPTLTHLMLHGAKIVLLTHMGRDPKNTNEQLAKVLGEYLEVQYVPALEGGLVMQALSAMKEGSVLLLENLRSHKGETENSESFAQTLASYGDFYVNDAFAVSHRVHASIVGIPKYLPSFAGVSFLEEYTELASAFTPKEPSLFILGGAKFETKEKLIEAYSDVYTKVFVGGAIANDFLKAKGYGVGESLLSSVSLKGSYLLEKENIVLPVDVVVGGDAGKRELLIEHVETKDTILDVGPRSVDALAPLIARAKTIVWNGPLGNYEAGFDDATKRCAELIAESGARAIVGGGDTVTAIEELNIFDSFDFVSTAGGAMLEFLEYKTLPGIEAL